MTLIIGLDVAKQCGWAAYNTERSISAIQAGVLKAEGEDFEDRAGALARQFGLLIKESGRPDLVAIERPLRRPPQGKRTVKMMGAQEKVEANNGIYSIISSNQLVGAVAGVCSWKGIPFITLADSTWRKSFLGFGTQKGWERKDWKRAVREACARERITVTNDDQADAVGIAIAAKNTPEFRQIQYEQSRRAA